VTVGLAATHHGPWSLAWGQLLGNCVAALMLFHLAKSWPRPGFNRRQAGELLRFGVPLAAASALMIGMLNIQYVVAGGMLGEVSLGIYLLAFNLSSWPVNVFSQVVRRVSLATFARVQDDPLQRQEAFSRMALLLAAATLPVCALLALLAVPIVTTLYGSVWRAAAEALPFLVLFGLVRVVAELSYDFLVALGRPRTTLWLQAGWICALAVALPLGAAIDGIRGVAIAHGVISLVLMLPAYAIAVSRTGVSMRALGAALVRPVAGCVGLVLAVLTVRALTSNSLLQLFLAGSVGLAVYVPLVWPIRHQLRQLDV
jgi:PST family polysaccharide transporter